MDLATMGVVFIVVKVSTKSKERRATRAKGKCKGGKGARMEWNWY